MADLGENVAKAAVVATTTITTGVTVPVIALAGVAVAIGYGVYKLFEKDDTIRKKNEALKAKDEEIKALKEKLDDFNQALDDYIKAYDKLKSENSKLTLENLELNKDNAELISMCEKYLAQLEDNQKLPSDYKGKMIAQLQEKRLQLKRSSAA